MTGPHPAELVDDAAAAFAAEAWQMRRLFAELAKYAAIPPPAAGQWPDYERTARVRLAQVAELCRAAAQGAALPLNVDACLSVARALNLETLPYEQEPPRRTAAEIDADELEAAASA